MVNSVRSVEIIQIKVEAVNGYELRMNRLYHIIALIPIYVNVGFVKNNIFIFIILDIDKDLRRFYMVSM